MSKLQQYPPSFRVLGFLLLLISIVFILIATRQLLVPLFFAVLFAYALYPASSYLESRYMSRILVNFLLILTSFVIFLGVLSGLALLVVSFSDELPRIQEMLEENLGDLRQSFMDTFGVSEERIDTLVPDLEGAGQYVGELFMATANTVLIIGLIPVYTFLLLHYRNKFREFISMAISSGHEENIEKIIDQSADVVPRYVKGLFIVCFILIFINSGGFYLIGVEYALFLGVLAAIFNLIPYLGTVIGYTLVFIFVFIVQSPSMALGVAAQFFIVQFTENNILTPNITGSNVQINPLFTIFSLIAAGMIWGLVGMFMIIPYLALLKIICDNIPELQHIGFLMGTRGAEKHAVSMKSIKEKIGL